MNMRALQYSIVLLGCAIGLPCQAAADQAVVRKPAKVPLEVGQAFVAHRGKQCVALLPTHVVHDAQEPSLRYVGTQTTRLGELRHIQNLGDDLSMGRIVGGIERDCGYSLASFSRAIDAQLAINTQGSLRFVNGDGSLGFEPVVWLDDDRALYIRIKPASDKGMLRKGMSGSLLMSADNTPLGILLSVSTRSGVGTVMRMDRILERAESALSTDAENNRHSSAARRDTDTQASITLAAWTAEAESAAARATNLLAQDQSTGPWISANTSKPIALDFNLAEKPTIRAVTLDVSGVASKLRPEAAEVFVTGDTAFHHARSVWGGTLDFSEADKANLRFAPTHAAAFRLVLYPKGAQVSVRRVHVKR